VLGRKFDLLDKSGNNEHNKNNYTITKLKVILSSPWCLVQTINTFSRQIYSALVLNLYPLHIPLKMVYFESFETIEVSTNTQQLNQKSTMDKPLSYTYTFKVITRKFLCFYKKSVTLHIEQIIP